MYVRVAAVVVLLLFLWPLATPACRAYWHMLALNWRLVCEAALGLALVTVWALRRLGELLFLRASGRRLRAVSQRS